MMIVDDDDKSKKQILKDSLLFFHISSLLRFPLAYERSLMSSLNIDVDDFTYTPTSHKWDNRLTLFQQKFQRCWVSLLLNPYCVFVVLLALCVLSFRVRLDTLGYASDFKNSKKICKPLRVGLPIPFSPVWPSFRPLRTFTVPIAIVRSFSF